MTFRTKLLQAILAIVVVTTAASLLIAQRQNAVLFQNVVNQLFAEQMKSFQQAQQLPIQAAQAEAGRLAKSVRLFAALEEGDPAEVYKIAGDELRLGEFAFFRLLDAKGGVIPPGEDSRAGAFDDAGLHGEWPPRGEGQAKVDFGFVSTQDGSVYQLLASPITNFDETVGTLILGQPMPRESSIILQGKFVGEGIPAPLREPLLAQQDSTGRIKVDGVEHRFTRFRLNEGSRYPPADWISVFSMAGLRQQQRTLAVRILLIGAAALVLAAVVGVLLSRQLARPVADLVHAAQKVREGDYAVSLPPTNTVELNKLGTAFNEMAAGLALRDRYHSVLQQVTDPRVAEELVQGRVKLGGELREVTVVFCDIRGYTALSAGRDPVEVIGILNHHMTALTAIVQKHRGVINQFAGDAIMILFGAPKSYGNDAEHAVRCAWEMMQERERLNIDAKEPLRIGTGIATGKVVAGCIGAESRSDYTVVGEKVNLAARLCSAASAGQIIIDAETRALTAAMAECETLPPLTLKGFAQPVPACRVTSLTSMSS
ncbi:MAG: adenylate/guanylate cyclase domain-containing protein [Prosthecobacter sp.]